MTKQTESVFHCGSQGYAKTALVILFAWLMWGTFCYSMMESVVPSILPLKLKELESSRLITALILTSLPGILNITVCPWVSFKSDRFRGKLGRRIPFMLYSLPFLCLSLLLIGWSENISAFICCYTTYAPATITIVLIAVFVLMFQFFNMFVGSVFLYLFNDIVPVNFLGRSMALFKITASAASILYNYFVFQYAASNMREIFTGAAILYFIGFGLMCLMVKEEKSPPLEGETARDGKGWGGLKTFFKQSFSNRFYWMIFLALSLESVTGTLGLFNTFLYKQMGLQNENITKILSMGLLSSDKINGILIVVFTILSAIIMYIGGAFVDRWHPLRICVYGAIFVFAGTLMNWLWIFIEIPVSFYTWISVSCFAISLLQFTIVNCALLPLQMRLFPKTRFGQFSMAQMLLCTLLGLLSAILAGIYFDFLKSLFNDSDFAYRLIFPLEILCSAASAYLFITAYREWYRLGGDKGFRAPAPWSACGFEKMPITQTVGPQARLIKTGLSIFRCRIIAAIPAITFLMYWMYCHHAFTALSAYGLLFLPLAAAAWYIWRKLEKNIRQDMQNSIAGTALKNGLPHHGMLMVAALKFVLLSGLWLAQIITAINMNLETAAILFGTANAGTDFMLIGAVWLLTKIERNHLTTLDKPIA